MTKLQSPSIANTFLFLVIFASVAAAREPVGRASANETIPDLQTTTDSPLECDASFNLTKLKLDAPIDGLVAASIADEFVRQWPKDVRSAVVLHQAITKLKSAWSLRIALIILLALISAVTAIISFRHSARTRTWLKLGMLIGLIGIVTCVILMTTFPHFSGVRKIESIASRLVYPTSILALIRIFVQNLVSLVCTSRFGLVVLLATATSLLLIVTRIRSIANPLVPSPRPCGERVRGFFTRDTDGLRIGTSLARCVLGFSLVLTVCFAGDAYLISRQNTAFMRRLAQDYPNSSRGRLAQGQLRRRERIGKPFELEFTDEISGRSISMKDLRGKVVVVNFWATWCGPCVAEMTELKRLYAKYHDRGVEFIGVSQDLPEKDGGLKTLKAFLEKEKIPWPQFYQGHDQSAVVTGSAENGFSESWGVDEIPTVFLIDADGKLYSTQARGQLDTLIPLVLSE